MTPPWALAVMTGPLSFVRDKLYKPATGVSRKKPKRSHDTAFSASAGSPFCFCQRDGRVGAPKCDEDAKEAGPRLLLSGTRAGVRLLRGAPSARPGALGSPDDAPALGP